MKKLGILLALSAATLMAQAGPAQAEQESLQRALGEAGNSPVEFARAIEHHLKQFPDSPQRAELERALVKTAIDLNDDRRVIEFGERILEREPDNAQFLEPVTTALLRKGDPAGAQRALEHAHHLEQLVQHVDLDLGLL